MLNKELIVQPIGPNGEFGTVTVGFVDGQLVSSVKLSPKAALDAIAKDIHNPMAQTAATFIEGAIGLA
jgi:uncharacterized membrane protein YgaE (UPF0421/DUF939 family)